MDLTLFYAPQTRATGVRILLEELGAPHTLHVLNRFTGENRQPEYLAVNPLGKVPAIRHGDAVVTEQVAIFLYLADAFPEAGLAPAIGDPLRGPYLRWLAFYGSSFEPAMVDHALKREPGAQAMSPYGSFGAVIDAVAAQLRPGPYLLGERMTAADLLWGMALSWMTLFKLLPERPEFAPYIGRFTARPAVERVTAADEAMAAGHKAAAGIA